ncbi:NAD-dependent epimerase/dehydratase family protein [Psychroflexus montanilacus]|uniref:NAD-dependent epimerase/dehydratase family protein n=1 Tax=Psychroflexus montanilacus TaxID=2873598 RepID=UPI001CCA728D|nr:NAD-dependent epimerase/dehydratase family protein [Psychroflexus montanilacus]MBZ9652878.1 NAD-dependent epimerase/dehydratase family protein [Psychroflexus montanilacus]
MPSKILIVGACGQIGSELTLALRDIHGENAVIASDIKAPTSPELSGGPFEILDATDYESFKSIVTTHDIDTVYMMAAMLSGTAEKFPEKGWDLNMTSLFNVLNLGKENLINKIFWPSSIAVFGPTTPKVDTPQQTVMEPTTVYGISKQAGERWCAYYHKRYGVDVRSIRYPGLISYKTPPGGGTTDYAIEIFHEALKSQKYTSFLSAETALPMMYMDDAIHATISIMDAPSDSVKIRSSYNLAGVSFTPEELYKEIKKQIPDFELAYETDFRQAIADSWPNSIDDTEARTDWGWRHDFNLEMIVKEMLEGVKSLEEVK